MGESNACMKKIVAAPTAGSCGVIPAVLLGYEEKYNATMQQMVEALYVASGIGEVIAARAFLAGAAGGCQAEVGSASAMAAGALAYLNGGDNDSIAHAAAMSLKNLLGLVCDTVGGLVEVPCVKRNVVGAVNAIASADMAVAGIRSQIPPDEVIDAMREIGESLPRSLRETGEGGLAATPTGQEIMNRLMNS
jgi:L-serine dehydratase